MPDFPPPPSNVPVPPGWQWTGYDPAGPTWFLTNKDTGKECWYDAGGRLVKSIFARDGGTYIYTYTGSRPGVRFIAPDGTETIISRGTPRFGQVTPMTLVATALYLIFLADIIDFYSGLLDWCDRVITQAAMLLNNLLVPYGQAIAYLTENKGRLSRINISGGPGAMAATAWVVGAQTRIQAAIDEVTRRRDDCRATWTTWQTFDCLAWVSDTSPKTALSDVRKHCTLYNDSVETALAWGRAIDEALKVFGSN